MFTRFEIATVDILILAGYLVLSRFVPLWLTRGKTGDADGFFLGGRNLVWPVIGFSLFATNMSGASFVGLAGAGYSQGISVYSYEWMAAVILIFFVLFILPFYLRSRIFTIPEFLEKRYDRRSRLVFSGMNVFFNIFIDAATALYAGGLVVLTLFPGTPLWIGVLALALLAGVLSIFGGLGAVVISDTIQAVVLIVGGIIVFFAVLAAVPSWESVYQTVPEGMLGIIQPARDPSLPWPGLLTGVLVIGLYYWTTSQLVVQRTIAAKDLNHARWGSLFAGFLKLPVLFVMILPGTMALLLYPDLENPDLVFPTLVFDLLPIGVRGVILSALVAAITSTVDSILNSASTMVTMDFVRTLRPDSGEKALVRTGRITTVAVMIMAVLWAPQIQRFSSLWAYLQSLLSYVTPPIVAVFLLGIFWKRANRHGALTTLTLGFGLGLLWFVLNEVADLFSIQFLYAAGISFLASVLLHVLVSLLTAPEPDGKTADLTWRPALWRAETEDLKGTSWWRNYRVLSAGLFLATAAIVIWFR